MSTVAIIGHTGFLGCAVTRHLLGEGFQVFGLSRSAREDKPAGNRANLFEVPCDITVQNQIEQALARSPWPIEAVVHLAARIMFDDENLKDRQSLFDVNLVGAHNVMLAAQAARIPHLVFASSMAVYGRPHALPVPERHPRHPLSYYGLMKKEAEDLLSWNGRTRETGVTILRLAGLYGPARHSGAIYQFVSRASRGEAIRVDLTKPVIWDVLHVEDASRAIGKIIEQGPAGVRVFNLDQGETIEVRAVAERIASWHGGRSAVVVEGDAESVPFQLDLTEAQRELDYRPASLEERVRQMAGELAVSA